MTITKEKIIQASGKYFEEAVKFRRHLHRHPELSFEEHQTCSWVKETLSTFGIETTRIGKTGLVGLIKGKGPEGKVVALRADMDALPIEEKSNKDYASAVKGVMHACGHDVHTASLMTTARILHELRSEFGGIIKIIFQPGEEKNPGGASVLIKEGVLHNPKPDVIIGQHVSPVLEVGKIGFREGKYMASSDELRLTVRGKGGHASTPELNVDPVLVAAHILVALQQVVSKNAGPKQPTVLSFGKVSAEGATNVVPDHVFLAGTFRALDEKWRKKGLEHIQSIAKGIAEGMGATVDIEISKGYPCLNNDAELTRRLRAAAAEYMGVENIKELDLTLGSEDFSYYSLELPASFYRLGTRNESKGIVSYVHTQTFDIDEQALAHGPGLMAWLALNELNYKPI